MDVTLESRREGNLLKSTMKSETNLFLSGMRGEMGRRFLAWQGAAGGLNLPAEGDDVGVRARRQWAANGAQLRGKKITR